MNAEITRTLSRTRPEDVRRQPPIPSRRASNSRVPFGRSQTSSSSASMSQRTAAIAEVHILHESTNSERTPNPLRLSGQTESSAVQFRTAFQLRRETNSQYWPKPIPKRQSSAEAGRVTVTEQQGDNHPKPDPRASNDHRPRTFQLCSIIQHAYIDRSQHITRAEPGRSLLSSGRGENRPQPDTRASDSDPTSISCQHSVYLDSLPSTV